MSSENNSIGAHVYQVYVLREWRVGVKGDVCPNHLHLCILFYLHPVSMLQLVILSITVQIHHASRPASPVSFSFWCGSVVIFRQVQLSEEICFCFSMLMVGLVSLSPVIQMSSSIHCLQPCNCYNMFKNRQVGALQPQILRLTMHCVIQFERVLRFHFLSFRNYFLSYI